MFLGLVGFLGFFGFLQIMSDSFLDGLPSHERGRWEKLKLRSPAEYARLREKVRSHGPEHAEKEMNRNAEFAEAKLHLETDPKMQEKAKDTIAAFIGEQGIDAALEKLPASAKEAMAKSAFEVTVDVTGKEPKLAVRPQVKPSDKKQGMDAPSGNVAEVFPLKTALQQQVMTAFKMV